MCHSSAISPTARQFAPVCHIGIARGTGALCGTRLRGDEVSYSPRDATCPACLARENVLRMRGAVVHLVAARDNGPVCGRLGPDDDLTMDARECSCRACQMALIPTPEAA